MTFREFLGNFFKKPSKSVSGDVTSESGSYEELYTGAINAFAVFAVIDMVASLCAAAELKTYKDGKPFKGLEWHNLNIRPNVNQSATEFWKEAYSKLLYEGHPAHTAKSSGLYKITVNGEGHVSAVTEVTKADITALGIPAQDTNTTYSAATQSAAGLMSAADKKKLDGVAEGATAFNRLYISAEGKFIVQIVR